MNDDFTPLLRDLPEPAPPSTMTSTIMARIEREVERKAEARVAAAVRSPLDLRMWLSTFAGIALVVVLFANGWMSLGMLPDLTSRRIGWGHAMLVPIRGPAMLLVGLGLLVYLIGLFAPLRNDGRNRP